MTSVIPCGMSLISLVWGNSRCAHKACKLPHPDVLCAFGTSLEMHFVLAVSALSPGKIKRQDVTLKKACAFQIQRALCSLSLLSSDSLHIGKVVLGEAHSSCTSLSDTLRISKIRPERAAQHLYMADRKPTLKMSPSG